MRFIPPLYFFLVSLLALPLNSFAHEWTRAEEIPGLTAYQGVVSAAWHDRVLHVVTNERNKDIKHAQRVNGQWIAPVALAHHKSGLVPDLAVSGGKLHMLELPGNFKIKHAIWDGRAWQPSVEIPDMQTRQRVETTGMDGVLHLTHGGKDSDAKRVYYAANAGWGWGHNMRVPNQTARSTASLAGLDGTLHMVYVSKNSFTVWHTTCTRWGEWTPPVQIPGVETRRFVDIVTANKRLFLVFTVGDAKQGDQAPVAWCEWSNGRWSVPTTMEGYVCYGSPSLAVEPGVPQQIHMFLPSRVGVLHLQTTDKTQLAPPRTKRLQRVN